MFCMTENWLDDSMDDASVFKHEMIKMQYNYVSSGYNSSRQSCGSLSIALMMKKNEPMKL